MIKLAISGICGKMGRRILRLAREDDEFNVIFGLEKEGHECVGSDAEGVKVESRADKISECDCLVDFSTPSATISYLKCAVQFSKSMVIGTTGFSDSEVEKIKEAAVRIPIVFSPNMSVGVNLLFKLIKEAACILKGYNIYMEEAHHVHKKDAPSGTAKKIADILNQEGFRIRYEDIVSIREDEIIGDHSVIFKSDVDEIELSHSAKTRDIFAQGALRAAKWVVGKSAGLYSMNEVLFGSNDK